MKRKSDKESGETLSLPHLKSSNASIRLPSGWVNNYALYASGKQFYLSDISSDTIYRAHTPEQQPEAIIVRTPPVKSLEGSNFFINMEGTTDRYFFFLRTDKKIKISQRRDAFQHMQGWMYDRQTRKTCLPLFCNDDYVSLKLDAHALIHCHSEENCLYAKLEAFDLIEALENDELSSELKSIAEGLQEDDNPVLMVVKL